MMTERDDDLPASKVVEQFGDEIRAAITAIAEETPTVAKTVAKNEVKNQARKTAVRWYAITVGLSALLAVVTSWAMLTYYPHPHAVDVTFRHGAQIEVCTRVPGSAPEHPVFVCRPDLR